MLCYKDKTFCNYKDCKAFDNCNRALTAKISEESDKYGLLLSVFAEKPPCFTDNTSDAGCTGITTNNNNKKE